MTGIEFEHFISEIELALRQQFKVINVRREISPYSFEHSKLIFDFNYDFHYSIDYDYLECMLCTNYSHRKFIENISECIKDAYLRNTILR